MQVAGWAAIARANRARHGTVGTQLLVPLLRALPPPFTPDHSCGVVLHFSRDKKYIHQSINAYLDIYC